MKHWHSRSIPACAGNTNPVSSLADPTTVHPRVCGEHPVTGALRVAAIGPSPRVRGTRQALWKKPLGSRSIPACAGNTPRWRQGSRTSAVHPRVCGEHLQDVIFSPRHERSIPACAGNTVVGVYFGLLLFGPSPRVRGTRAGGPSPDRTLRSIPACAGNTYIRSDTTANITGPSPRVRGTRSSNRRQCCSIAVHPRVCGEHPDLWRRAHLPLRSIPACAGNTHASRSLRASSPGPSPRVRGTLA